jgi:hypothetical protein
MSNARNPGVALTLRKAAQRGQMGESTLRQALASGHGPRAYKRPGSNRWRIFPDDFDAWATSNVASPGPIPEAAEDPI